MKVFSKLLNKLIGRYLEPIMKNVDTHIGTSIDDKTIFSSIPVAYPKKNSIWCVAKDLKSFRVVDYSKEKFKVTLVEDSTNTIIQIPIEAFDILFVENATPEQRTA